jgi:anti-sigma regulatory factor (Ser/Thr protein kinase)
MASCLQLPLAPDPASAKVARNALSSLPLPEETRDTAELLTTELVTNAVRHADMEADATIHVQIDVEGEAVRIAVSDPGRRFPGIRVAGDPVEPQGPGGLGLVLVERLASRWGLERGSGTRVWCELDTAVKMTA